MATCPFFFLFFLKTHLKKILFAFFDGFLCNFAPEFKTPCIESKNSASKI
jgi:hypothetical protein